MRVLVTGGGGFLGRHLALRLEQQGYEVTILGRHFYPRFGKTIRFLKIDLCDSNSTIEACADHSVIFHAAALAGIWGKKNKFYASNVDATRNLIEGCQRHNVQKLIYTSSPSVIFGNSCLKNVDESELYPEKYSCEYPRTKAIAERMILDANNKNGLLTVSLRPHLIWGPGDPHIVPRILKRAREGKLVQVGDGENIVDMIYIDNAVEAHIRALEMLDKETNISGQCYFVSDDQPVNLWMWIKRLLYELEIPGITRKISHKKAYLLGFILEGIYKILGLSNEPKMTRFLANQLACSHYFNISRARKKLGYQPIVSAEEGWLRLINYLKSHPMN